MKTKLTLIALVFILSSCAGLQPDKAVLNDLASIEISTKDDTPLDYEFQRHLASLLDSSYIKDKRYKLELDLKRTATIPVLQKEADTIRETLEFTVKYNIQDMIEGTSIYSGKFRQISSYNTLFSPFSTNLEMQKTEHDIYKSSADEMRRKLIIFFKRRNLSK